MDDTQNSFIAEIQSLLNSEVNNQEFLMTPTTNDLTADLLRQGFLVDHLDTRVESQLVESDLLAFDSIINAKNIADANIKNIADIVFEPTNRAVELMRQAVDQIIQSDSVEAHWHINEQPVGVHLVQECFSSQQLDQVLSSVLHATNVSPPPSTSAASPIPQIGVNPALSWIAVADSSAFFRPALPVPGATP